MLRFASTLGLLLVGTVVCVEAQWLNHRDPTIPRTADGKPDLAASAQRFSGKPDVSGVWQAERTPVDEFVKVLGPGLPQIQPDRARQIYTDGRNGRHSQERGWMDSVIRGVKACASPNAIAAAIRTHGSGDHARRSQSRVLGVFVARSDVVGERPNH